MSIFNKLVYCLSRTLIKQFLIIVYCSFTSEMNTDLLKQLNMHLLTVNKVFLQPKESLKDFISLIRMY